MTIKQKQLELFKVRHKLLIIKHNDTYKTIPIINTIAYTVWILKHNYNFNVVANIQGIHEDIKDIVAPFSRHKDLENLKATCETTNIKFTYIATPTVPNTLPQDLLIDTKDYLKHFGIDGAALLQAGIDNQKDIKNYYSDILELISTGLYTVNSQKGFSYFDSYITQLSLLGGINGVLNKYPSKLGTQVSQVQTLKNILNRKASTVQMYINRYTNELKDTTTRKPVPHINTPIKDTGFTLPRAVREHYEILIEPYIKHQRKLSE